MTLSIICALAQDHAIGFENRLLFRLSADLKRFKELTTGHTIIMGRKTFESLPKGALPNRRNVVLSRRADVSLEGCEVFGSLKAALQSCGEDEQVFIIGGESVYAEALPLADRLYLTHVKATPAQADAFFPKFDASAWKVVKEEAHEADEKNECPYVFADYERA
jgi:dihydrofolate reductase